MSTQIEQNTEALEEILQAVNELPEANEDNNGTVLSVQADWNQTDETAADFIKNKPFGEFPIVLYEGTDLSPTNEDGAYLIETPIFEIVEGESYSVVLDGAEYVSEGVNVLGAYIILGNPGIGGGEDNGLPFMWMHNPDVGMMLFIAVVPFTSLCISADNTKKLSAKYCDVQAVFYAKSPYIYTDIARTVKATKADVLAVVNKMPIVIDWAIGKAPAVYVGTSDDYAEVFFYANTTSDTLAQSKLHTAEYTE